MQTLIEVLIERDGMSREEAEADIAACRAEMLEAIEDGDFSYAEQIYEDWFGLEPDYMDEVIG